MGNSLAIRLLDSGFRLVVTVVIERGTFEN
jgi:hypothetical protein